MRLLLVLVCALTHTLVNAQCDENSCTIFCYPVHWQRDLCLFYQQLTVWRDSASGCGLTLPPLPESRPGIWPEGVSSEEQWQIASEYWEEVTSLWERRYDSGQESVTVSPLIVMATNAPPLEPTDEFLEPDNDDFSGSGSGSDITTDLPTMSTTTMATDEPTTAESGTDAPMLNNEGRWNASNEEWELLFTRWVESSRQGAGLRLPSDMDVGVVIDSYGENEQVNREAWSQLIGFWRENHDIYDASYNGVCPE